MCGINPKALNDWLDYKKPMQKNRLPSKARTLAKGRAIAEIGLISNLGGNPVAGCELFYYA